MSSAYGIDFFSEWNPFMWTMRIFNSHVFQTIVLFASKRIFFQLYCLQKLRFFFGVQWWRKCQMCILWWHSKFIVHSLSLRYLSSFILFRLLKKNPWHPTLKSKFIINVARSEAIHFDLLYYLQIIQNVTCEIGYYYLTRLYGLCVLSVLCNSSFMLSSSIFWNFFFVLGLWKNML